MQLFRHEKSPAKVIAFTVRWGSLTSSHFTPGALSRVKFWTMPLNRPWIPNYNDYYSLWVYRKMFISLTWRWRSIDWNKSTLYFVDSVRMFSGSLGHLQGLTLTSTHFKKSHPAWIGHLEDMSTNKKQYKWRFCIDFYLNNIIKRNCYIYDLITIWAP